MEAPMNNLYIGLLRLENRAAFFVQAKASQVTPRETAEEQFHTLARGWFAYPVTPRTHIYRRRAVVEAHFVAERRHPHVTRYAERSGSVPGLSASPSQLRAGGTPLPHKQRTLPCEKPPKSGCRGIQRGTFRRGAFWAAN